MHAMVLAHEPEAGLQPVSSRRLRTAPALTPRELVVLREFAVCEGTTAEIAERLGEHGEVADEVPVPRARGVLQDRGRRCGVQAEAVLD